MKRLRNIAICLFLLAAIVIFFFQSNWGKAIAIDSLKETLNESGLQVEIGKYEGSFPHAIRLSDVKIESERFFISIETLSARISLFALLKKEFLFTDLTASGIFWQKKGEAPLSFARGTERKYAVTIKHFQLTDVHLEENLLANLKGSARIGRKTQDASLNVTVTRNDFPDAKLYMAAHLDPSGLIRTRGSLESSTLRALPVSLPFDASVNCQFVLGGNVDLLGRISGTLTPTSLEIEALSSYIEREWKIDSHFARKNGVWSFSRLRARNDLFSLSGAGSAASSLIQLKTNHPKTLSQFEISRLEDGTMSVKGVGGGDNIELASLHLEKFKAEGNFLFKDDALSGSGTVLSQAYGNLWKGKTNFSWENGGSLFLNEATLEGPSSLASGNLEIRPNRILLGETDLAIENLHDLNPNYYGKLEGKIHWLVLEGKQVASLDFTSRDFFFDHCFMGKSTLEASLIDPFKNPQGRIVLDAEQVKWKDVSLDALSFETLLGAAEQHFAVSALGRLKHPLSLNLAGEWRYENGTLMAILQSGSGSFYNHPLDLESRVDLEIGPNRFLLSPLNLSFSRGALGLFIEKKEDEIRADLNLEHFPLDLLSVNPLDIAINGETDCKISFHEKQGKVDGTIDATIYQLGLPSLEESLSSSGTLKGAFDNERLTLSGRLQAKNAPFLDLDLSLPIKIEMSPPSFQWLYEETVGGHLSFNGRIEEILDFFDLGNHWIEGDISCDFQLNNTLENPDLDGNFSFQNGTYENYLTGTHLFDIEAAGRGKGARLYLDSFKATDYVGSVSAKGKVALSPLDDFPFLFNVSFDRFQVAEIDLVSAEIEGNLQIAGNAKAALAKGDLEILQTNLHVPNKIPRTFPNLVVVYRNAQKPIEHASTTEKEPYPLHLDINVKAPEAIFIDGRGLDSEWKGKFHIGGTFTELSTLGRLELIKGDFLFSGREFKLLDGSLSFKGKEFEMPTLNLVGQMQVKDILITAQLKGPLNNPQLTLQSVPPLPLGTIMSYLLFGQELAEINSFQALQLANSIAALAGQGPDVLEKTRKALGVDRLTIVTVPSEEPDVEDTIALQVGKYVSEGVLISLTQGAEDAAPNINIAIELSGGWVIQLDSDQRQEQGKFTVRWNRTY
jgi:autotransporter translocation and assembly factor TamB